MLYDRTKYIGKEIMLFPNDSVKKMGIIEWVDDLGFTVRLTKVSSAKYEHEWKVGDRYFVNHHNISFKFVD